MNTTLRRTLYIAALALIFILLDIAITSVVNDRDVNILNNATQKNAASLRANLELDITKELSAINALASYIKTHPYYSAQSFNTIAGALIDSTKYLKNLAAAPDFIIKDVYPIQGNKAIIGLNYKELKGQWADVELAIKTGKMVIAGPIDLIQGGKGLIGRAPVKIKSDNVETSWGIVSSVIDFDKLVRNIKKYSVSLDMEFAIYKNNNTSDTLIQIYRTDKYSPSNLDVEMPIHIPNGNWKIVAAPSLETKLSQTNHLYMHLSFIAIFITILLAAAYKLKKDNQILMSEARFKDFTNSSSDWVWEVDTNQIYTFVSGNYKNFLGYDEEELLGKSPLDFMHPKERERVQEAIGDIIEKRLPIKDLENWHVSKDGMKVCVQTNGNPFFDKDGVYIGYRGVDVDITDRKMWEETIQASKDQLNLIFDTTRDGIAIMDLETNFMHVNNAYSQMTEYSYDELMEKSCSEMSHKDDLPKSLKAIEHVIEEGYLDNFVKRCITKSGKEIIVRMSMSLMPDKQRLLVATQDITELEKSQEKLRENQETLKRYYNIVDDNVIITQTDLDMAITYASRAFCNITGYSASELIGENIKMLRDTSMPEECYKEITETINADKVWHGELRELKKDGSSYWVENRIIPLINRDNEKYGYMNIRQDITLKKELERISVTDRLTGIYNRLKLDESIQAEHKRYLRYRESYSLILFDIDHFKSVNDTYGHLIGDYVLKELSMLASNLVRKTDILGRWGGEEFLVICPNTDIDGAVSMAENLRKKIADHKFEHVKQITSSFGVASIELVKDYDKLMKIVDDALYKAKNEGRNCVRTPDVDTINSYDQQNK